MRSYKSKDYTKKFKYRYSPLFLSKIILTIAIIGLYVYAAVYGGMNLAEDDIYPARLGAPLITLCAYLISLALEFYVHYCKQKRSGILFTFRVYMLVGSIIRVLEIYIKEARNYNTGVSLSILIIDSLLVLFSSFAEPSIVSDFTPSSKNECPELYSGFPSIATFWWFNSLIMLGYKKPLTEQDLWKLNVNDKTEYISKRWDGCYKPDVTKGYKPSLTKGMIRAFGPLFLAASAFKLINDCLQFLQPLLLELIINFIDSDYPVYVGYIYSVILFLSALLTTICLHQYFHRVFRIGMNIRTALIDSIYKKALVLSAKSRNAQGVGQMVTLMSTDAQRLMDLATYFTQIWSSPLQIAIAIGLLYQQLGWCAFVGLAVLLILMPINFVLGGIIRKITINNMKTKTKRIKKTNELLTGIKVLKLYAWEEAFEIIIEELRNNELKNLWKTGKISAWTSLIWGGSSTIVSLITFFVYIVTGTENDPHILTSAKTFTSLTLFNILRFPLNMLPYLVVSISQAMVSINRLTEYFNMSELDSTAVEKDTSKPCSKTDVVLSMKDSSYVWESDAQDNQAFDAEDKQQKDEFKLSNWNLEIKHGELVAVIGSVGSGKSSFLQAILGDMTKRSGTAKIYGKIAYVPQQAWIFNSTLENNILFGVEKNDLKYKQVVNKCALKSDLEMLPAGDQTEIGEKGINLSGGQKQRVAVARAVYSDADTYLLDDPLSAVDAHVGKYIFKNVLSNKTGHLREKTRILVTNAMQYVQYCDRIIIVDQGCVVGNGSYSMLMDDKFCKDMLLKFGADNKMEDNHDDEANTRKRYESQNSVVSVLKEKEELLKQISKKEKDEQTNEGKLINKETSEIGRIKFQVFKDYFSSQGTLTAATVLITHICTAVFPALSKTWLSEWSEATDAAGEEGLPDSDNYFYIGIYAAISLVVVLNLMGASLSVYWGGYKASKTLHEGLLKRVVYAPMSWFDTTPLGRILNRFSKDVASVDDILPRTFSMFFKCVFDVLATLVVITVATPPFLAVMVPVFLIYFFTQRYYVATSRQLKRLESVTRSPIYSHFGETLSGVTSIRAFSKEQDFLDKNTKNIDRNQATYYPNVTSNRWLAIRLEFTAALVVLAASIFATVYRSSNSAAIAGLSISYALSITQTLNWAVRQTSEIETNIVSVERITEYSQVKQEAAYKSENIVDDKWPSKGNVTFKNYSTRYREGLDLVIKNINVEFKAGEKVGIVGRTGAGKSSLTLALFRIIESAEGEIVIDDETIEKLGLHEVRSRLTIIPQDPMLWSGTVRENLDPFGYSTDEDIWNALAQSHLKSFVQQKEHGLNSEVSEGGENFSVGQRQLFCLARALLRKSKILILDEATAAVDPATDNLIQETIRTTFKGWTVITIAHRLNTIIDYDKILVLDKGEVKEFDTPDTLLKDKQGIFTSLCSQAGLL